MLPLRSAVDADAQDLFGLMALCFAQYPGCFVDPHDDLPDLVRPGHWKERTAPGPANALHRLGGEFLVMEDERGRIAACVAVDFPNVRSVPPAELDASGRGRRTPDQGRIAELHRLYVRPDCRKRGIAAKLVARVEALAREQGAGLMILWSDTRFSDAHRLYQRLGYEQAATTRELGDISGTTEYHFAKRL